MARTREKIQFANTCVRAIKALKKMKKEKPKKLEKDIDEMAKSVIAKWYASYEPNRYNRLRSLYHSYRIERDGVDVEITFDPSYIEDYPHHQQENDELVYRVTVYGGYHGGSWGTDKNGVTVRKPYWRTPYRAYLYWGSSAPRSTPIFKTVMNKTNQLLDRYEQSWTNDLMQKVISPIERSLGGLRRK